MSNKYIDLGFKEISLKNLKGLLKVLGIDATPKKLVSVNYVGSEGRKMILDLAFLDTDNIIHHIEFQSRKPTLEDMVRFFEYDAALMRQYKTEVRTYIVTTANVLNPIKRNPMHNWRDPTPRFINFIDFDGDEILNRISDKVENNLDLTDKEQAELSLIAFFKTKNDIETQLMKAAKIAASISWEKPYGEDICIIQKFFADKFAENSNQIYEVLIVRSKAIQERYERIKNEGKEEGIKEGIIKGKVNVGRNMLNEGFSIEDIMKITNLTNEQINSL